MGQKLLYLPCRSSQLIHLLGGGQLEHAVAPLIGIAKIPTDSRIKNKYHSNLCRISSYLNSISGLTSSKNEVIFLEKCCTLGIMYIVFLNIFLQTCWSSPGWPAAGPLPWRIRSDPSAICCRKRNATFLHSTFPFEIFFSRYLKFHLEQDTEWEHLEYDPRLDGQRPLLPFVRQALLLKFWFNLFCLFFVWRNGVTVAIFHPWVRPVVEL